MPLLNWICSCKNSSRTIGTIRPTAPPRCSKCGKEMRRDPQPPTSRIVETLDNGVMSRRVERPADAERLYKERAAADQERIKNPKL